MASGRRPKWLRIPAPVALVGESVDVRNYRRKDYAWERGELLSAEFIPPQIVTRADQSTTVFPGFWRYVVLLDARPSRADGRTARLIRYRLSGSDADLRRIA